MLLQTAEEELQLATDIDVQQQTTDGDSPPVYGCRHGGRSILNGPSMYST
jgi:hypothetical protein